MRYLILGIFIIGVASSGCSSKVEDVTFTVYSNRNKNNLLITVNTKKGLFQGRENFLSFTRHHYSFSMRIKGNEYTEQDMVVTIYGDKQISIEPERGRVKIANEESNRIAVNVDISDARIPQFINGNYVLTLVESDSNHRWYKMK